MASQITGILLVCSATDQRKHQSSLSLAFVRGIPNDQWILSQKASYMENGAIWSCHHGQLAIGAYIMMWSVMGSQIMANRLLVQQLI